MQVIEDKCPQAKAQIETLKLALSSQEIEAARLGALVGDLDVKLQNQTARANSVVDQYNKAVPQIESLKASRHRWMICSTRLAILLGVAAIWIFRKPLMALTGL